jgi:cell division protein FtsI (penicillin-binding protein 3)
MRKRVENGKKGRIILTGAVFTLFFLAVAARGFWLQVLEREQTADRARRQYQRIVPLTPRRGAIHDRHGRELARSIDVDSVFAEPWRITDVEAEVRVVTKVLGLSPTVVRNQLRSKKRFCWLKRQVQPRESKALRGMKLPGIGFTKEHRRFYPNGEIAAHLLGFTGLDPNGLEGLELKYDNVLLGQKGFLVTSRDARGKGLGASSKVVEGGSHGHSLRLSVDKTLQYVAEKELAAGLKEAEAQAGCVVVLDPRSGEILALANQPTYNPNAFARYPAASRRNRAICDTFEPGSTLKPFLVAAALNEQLVRPTQMVDCEKGSYRVGGMTIHDHHAYDRLTVAEVVKYSSNIGAAKIGKLLERRRFYDYLRAFGFGGRSGIDFPGEAVGLLRPPEQWFEGDLASISFGQGMTVTALQLARATAVIANGGLLMQADLVRQVVDDQGTVLEQRTPGVVRRVISEQAARQVRDMMTAVSEQGGTGTLAAVPGFLVGGKTGTAQKVDRITGGYSEDKRIASFAGFVPARQPALVILVVIDEPRSQVYGGLVAAPVFSRVAAASLRYLGVAPTEPVANKPLPPPVVEAPVAISTGHALPAPATDKSALRMPDCRGLSCRQVLRIMQKQGLDIRLKGSGRVVEQFPAPGQAVRYGDETWVRLAPSA